MKQLTFFTLLFAFLAGCNDKVKNTPVTSTPVTSNPVTSNHTKEIITFKGISFGQPGAHQRLEELCKEAYQIKECRIDPTDTKIDSLTTYGNLTAIGSFTLNNNDSLASVQMWGSEDEMVALAAVLKGHYGKPETSSKDVRNERGFKAVQTTYFWEDSRGSRITLESIVDGTNNGKIFFSSPEVGAKIDALNDLKKKTIKESL